MSSAQFSRRKFFKNAAIFAAAPFVLTGRSSARFSAAGSRLTLGCIGTGKQMGILLSKLLPQDDVQVVAVCDVDTTRREHTKQRVEKNYSELGGVTYKGCTAYGDFRELLARDDIDAVVVATPDHWHAVIAIAAVRAGKDVYCEKPLTYNIHEAVALVRAVRETDRVLQTGSQQRSMSEFRVAAELIRNGVIGHVKTIDVHFRDPAKTYDFPAESIEPGLDWDMWCGPGPLVDYNPVLSPRGVHTHYPDWRSTWEFGGGNITDWGAHHIDISQWALDMDGSGPVEVRAPQDWENAKEGVQLIYANGTVLTHRNDLDVRRGVSFYGTDGEVHVYRGQFEFILDGKPIHRFRDRKSDPAVSLNRAVELTRREYLADAKIALPRSDDHIENFLEAVKTRQRPICDVAIGAGSVIACHLMNLGYRYGANVKWDPSRNEILSGGEAAWLTRDHYRAGWEV